MVLVEVDVQRDLHRITCKCYNLCDLITETGLCMH